MRRLAAIIIAVVLLGTLAVVVILIWKAHCSKAPEVPVEQTPTDVTSEGCGSGETAPELVRCIRNDDIKWEGMPFGLWPEPTGPALALLDTQEDIKALLLDAVLDEERYVAAHVLLSLRYQGSFATERKGWNGLRVQLYADGRVTFEGNDLEQLHEHWEGFLRWQEESADE